MLCVNEGDEQVKADVDSASTPSVVGAKADDGGKEKFAHWFTKNYPPMCVIARPEWHAPRIYRAATYLLEQQRDDLAEALRTIECLEETSPEGLDFESIVVQTQTIARAALAKLKS